MDDHRFHLEWRKLLTLATLLAGFVLGAGAHAIVHDADAAPLPLRLAMPPGSWPVELTLHDVDGTPVKMKFACQGETSH